MTIALISLTIGGIGVMNIMLFSVTEWTHEIAIRRALGTQRHDIRARFLIEAIIVTPRRPNRDRRRARRHQIPVAGDPTEGGPAAVPAAIII